MLYAGIDEAGYGPLLGPLCLAAVAFVVPGPADDPPDLWDRLDAVVCRRRQDARRRIAVEDSKKLKGAGDGVPTALERGVLAFLPELPDDDALLAHLGAALPPLPWYARPEPLPATLDAGLARIDAARLARALADAGMAVAAHRCVAIDAEAFNERVARTDNKAEIGLSTTLALAAELVAAAPDGPICLRIDRQGGRRAYREALVETFPGCPIRVLEEAEGRSAYRLDRPRGPIDVAFEAGAESLHLPVALASMTAKLVRELAMRRLNRYFADRLPGLRPTAGYVADGRRFVAEIETILAREPELRPVLIRSR